MANQITLDIVADVQKATAGIGDVKGQLSQLQKTASSGRSIMKGALAADVIQGGVQAIGGALKDAWDTVKQQGDIAAQTSAVLKSTGGAAGVSAQGISDLAQAIEGKSTIDAEAIQSGENLLLTFTNIQNRAGQGNDVFNQTTQAMADMATAMGSDPKTAAMQLGKALNDPVKGMSALGKVGVTFTKQQKDQAAAMVKAGNVAGAQKIILGELNKEFGGSAAASAATFSGAMFQIKDALGGVLEQGLAKLMPSIQQFATWTADKLPPALATLSAKTQELGRFLAPLGHALEQVFGFMKANPEVVAAFTAVVAGAAIGIGAVTAAQWLWNAAMAANPIGLTILAIAALVAAGVYLWTHSDQLKAKLSAAWQGISGAVSRGVSAAISWVSSLPGRAAGALSGFASSIMSKIKAGLSAMGSGITSGITTAVGFFAGLPGRAAGALSSLAGNLVGKARAALSGFGSSVSSGASTAVQTLAGIPGRASGALSSLPGNLAGKARSALSSFGTAVTNGASSAVRTLAGLPGRMSSAVSTSLYGAGSAIMGGFLEGLRSRWGDITNFVGGIADWIQAHKGPISYDRKLLIPAGVAIMRSLNDGLASQMPRLGQTLANVTDTIRGIDASITAPTIGLNIAATGQAAQAPSTVVHVHMDVDATTDPVSVGRNILRVLQDYSEMTGARLVIAP